MAAQPFGFSPPNPKLMALLPIGLIFWQFGHDCVEFHAEHENIAKEIDPEQNGGKTGKSAVQYRITAAIIHKEGEDLADDQKCYG